MTFRSVCLSILLSFLTLGALQAQRKPKAQTPARQLFQLPDSLLVDVKLALSRSSSRTADSVAQAFASAYEGRLSPEQRQLAFAAIQRMQQKRYPVNPDLENFLACTGAEQTPARMAPHTLTRFLEVADSSVVLYTRAQVANLFAKTRLLLESELLYRAKFNQLQVEGGTLAFALQAPVKKEVPLPPQKGPAPKEEEPQPADPQQEQGWFDQAEQQGNANNKEELQWQDNQALQWENAERPIEEAPQETAVPSKQTQEQERWQALSMLNSDQQGVLVPEPVLARRQGPILQLKDARLHMRTQFDTLSLQSKLAELLLLTDSVNYTGGHMEWHAGSPMAVDIPQGAFLLRAPRVEAEKAMLQASAYHEQPIEGHFLYQADRFNNQERKARFPQFKSYENRYALKVKAEGVDLRGGISLQGARFSTASYSGAASVLTLSEGGKVKARASSPLGFSLNDSLIFSPATNISLYQAQQDSIVHPAVAFRYHPNGKHLELRKNRGAYNYSPFLFTYHGVSMLTDVLEWNIAADSLELRVLSAANKVPSVVESEEYFHPKKFTQLQGSMNFQPLLLVLGYASERKSNIFASGEVARARGLNPAVVRLAMRELALERLINYNPRTDMVLVLPRARFLAGAYAKLNNPDNPRNRTVYDNLILLSVIQQQANAKVDLQANALHIRGVNRFSISDSLKVSVTPSNGEVVLYQHKAMDFGGTMTSGNMVFRGKKFDFNYKDFDVKLTQVDSISFLVKDREGTYIEAPNSIVETGGKLQISDPDNRSGLDASAPPSFSADKGGRMYFDKQEILNKAYDKRLYFQIPPFEVKNTNSDTDLAFDGTFSSDGMLPDFQTRLALNREEKAFEFSHKTPEQGYPAYKGKGTYLGGLHMGRKGLRGQGKVKYLDGDFRSEDFIFYSDSLLTAGSTASIASTKNNTDMQMANYYMRWLVDTDSMLLYSTEDNPFKAYAGKLDVQGRLAYLPGKLMGRGMASTAEFEAYSPDMHFQKEQFAAKQAELRIRSEDPKLPAVLATGVLLHMDSAGTEMVARAETDSSLFNFPKTSFTSNIREAEWKIQQKKVFMNADKGMPGIFTSTHLRDTLTVAGGKALYDLADYSLNIRDVQRLQVGELEVLPDSSGIVIRAGGKVDLLQHATITLDAEHRYHRLRDASLLIYSGKDYEGRGYYDFQNEAGEKSSIFFNRIKQKPLTDPEQKGSKAAVIDVQTVAYATISEDSAFRFIPGVEFAGEAKLIDDKQKMALKGKARLTLDRPINPWFAYESRNDDPNADTLAPIMVDDNLFVAGTRVPIKAGVYIGVGNPRDLYGLFMDQDTRQIKGRPVFRGHGPLRYRSKGLYQVVSPEVTGNEPLEAGNQLFYDTAQHQIRFLGRVDLIAPDEKAGDARTFGVEASGLGTMSVDTTDLDMRTLMRLRFNADGKFFDEMLADLAGSQENKGLTDQNRNIFNQLVVQLLSPEQKAAVIDEEKPLEEVMGTGILLHDLQMKWSEEFRAFYSTGDIALASLYGRGINARVEGFVEAPKGKDDHTLTVYLRNKNTGKWYYVSYAKDGITAFSNNNLAMAYVGGKSDLKPEDVNVVGNTISRYYSTYLQDDNPVELNIQQAPVAPPPAQERKGKDKEESKPVQTIEEAEEMQQDEPQQQPDKKPEPPKKKEEADGF